MNLFNVWDVVDLDGTLMVQGKRVSWFKADRSAVRYISKEMVIHGDFEHSFIVCIKDSYVEDELNRGLLRLWEIRKDWDNRIWIYARKKGDRWTIHYEQKDGGVDLWAFHSDETFIMGQRYIIEISREGIYYMLRVLDEDRTLFVDSGMIEGVLQECELVWLASTINARRNKGNWSIGYIESMSMQNSS
jgi:hypothetical protein